MLSSFSLQHRLLWGWQGRSGAAFGGEDDVRKASFPVSAFQAKICVEFFPSVNTMAFRPESTVKQAAWQLSMSYYNITMGSSSFSFSFLLFPYSVTAPLFWTYVVTKVTSSCSCLGPHKLRANSPVNEHREFLNIVVIPMDLGYSCIIVVPFQRLQRLGQTVLAIEINDNPHYHWESSP